MAVITVDSVYEMSSGSREDNLEAIAPYNPFCTNPPKIVYEDRVVLQVTKNEFYSSPDRVPSIAPDFLFDILLFKRIRIRKFQSNAIF